MLSHSDKDHQMSHILIQQTYFDEHICSNNRQAAMRAEIAIEQCVCVKVLLITILWTNSTHFQRNAACYSENGEFILASFYI